MDKSGNYNGFYPIISTNVELLENNGVLLVRFHFMNGERITLEYTKIIHLRRFYYKHDIYGEPNDTALNPTLELINTSNQGIINAVKSSAFLRGILKFSQSMLKDEDIKAQRDKFVTEYLSLDNNGGIGALDSKADFIPLKSEPVTVDEKQLQHIKQSVYNYFGVNEKIINSTYSEEEWNAFYESVLEPIALQMSLEFTSKIFTEREKGHGNEIIFEANRLQYASNTTKINLIKETLPFGLLTINEAREILNLAPVDGGDKRLQSLNFVDSNVANDYQLGKKVEEENDGE
jgi:HK97 family phage portal protein